jgi:pimeloyl-ACP methyl ester carboxylesterase
MITELITFRTPDGVALDGAWYRPEGGARAATAALLVHGKARNFYTGPSRFLAPHVVARGFAALAINRRGHDVIYSKPGLREPAGAAYEVFADSQQDLLGAAEWLAGQGYSHLALVGHSFGGVASTHFAAEHPERVAALVLCSAAAGGPDYLERVSRDWLAGDALFVLLERARGMRAAGRGEDLLLAPRWWWAISARSALELDVPDLAEAAGRTRCPILAIRGSLEPVDAYPIERVREAAGGRATTAIVGGNHYYAGYENDVGGLVADWLAKTL